MYFKTSIVSTLIALSLLCSAPAFAQSATAGSSADAAAFASALVKTGKVYSNGGLGCPNGFATPVFSMCYKTKHDKNMEQANLIIDAANAGFFFTDDVSKTVMYRAVGYDYKGMREVSAVTTASSKSVVVSTSKPAKGPLMSYNGEFAKSSKKVQADILECRVLYNNKQIKDCVGKY